VREGGEEDELWEQVAKGGRCGGWHVSTMEAMGEWPMGGRLSSTSCPRRSTLNATMTLPSSDAPTSGGRRRAGRGSISIQVQVQVQVQGALCSALGGGVQKAARSKWQLERGQGVAGSCGRLGQTVAGTDQRGFTRQKQYGKWMHARLYVSKQLDAQPCVFPG
jgi:hypothetical protein